MGTRLSYLISNYPFSLPELLERNYESFRKRVQAEIAEWGTADLSGHVIQIIRDYERFPPLEALSQVQVDAFVGEFIGGYCNTGPGKSLFQEMGAAIRISRYKWSSLLVAMHLDPWSQKIWNYLLYGRSLLNDERFQGIEEEFRIGFWSWEEQQHLANALEQAFGKIDRIKETGAYWTAEEDATFRESLRQTIADELFTPLPASSYELSQGIETVLEILHLVSSKRTVLVLWTC